MQYSTTYRLIGGFLCAIGMCFQSGCTGRNSFSYDSNSQIPYFTFDLLGFGSRKSEESVRSISQPQPSRRGWLKRMRSKLPVEGSAIPLEPALPQSLPVHRVESTDFDNAIDSSERKSPFDVRFND